jgi:L-ascorbate metabolism protein UlaG (beta-lactamase superfamily)
MKATKNLETSHIPKINLRTIPFIFFFFLRGVFEYLIPPKKVNATTVKIKNDELKVWMIGHATTLINFFGTTILTDPVFVRGIPFPSRLIEPGLAMNQLPKIDFLLISHAHMDHFNKSSLKKLSVLVDTIIIPRNCKSLLKNISYKTVIELDWEQETKIADVTIKAFQPIHWGDRYPWQAYLNRGYNSYILQKNGKTVFFCGDSGYGNFFKKLGSLFDIDIALMPISAYSPSVFRKVHLNPEDAILAFTELRAKHLVPIHWGNFRLSFEPIKEPAKWLAKLAEKNGISNKLHILENNENFTLK